MCVGWMGVTRQRRFNGSVAGEGVPIAGSLRGGSVRRSVSAAPPNERTGAAAISQFGFLNQGGRIPGSFCQDTFLPELGEQTSIARPRPRRPPCPSAHSQAFPGLSRQERRTRRANRFPRRWQEAGIRSRQRPWHGARPLPRFFGSYLRAVFHAVSLLIRGQERPHCYTISQPR
jgi:hypothetical protein